MTENEFVVLRYFAENMQPYDTEQGLADKLNISSGELELIFQTLQDKDLLDQEHRITPSGMEALEPYKVDNAVILAAGMSTRFAPISYAIPKGLISVKGDIMVERLIRQLSEAGVNDITIVVGYMMDKYLYLKDKYPVKFVVNDEYMTKNTYSSVYAARDFLRNTYIVSSDNYYPHNLFHSYEYHAIYTSVFAPGVLNEIALVFDEDNKIIGTNMPSDDQWIMYGHAYFSRNFSERFRPILEAYYLHPVDENVYWENVYADHVDELPMWIAKYSKEDILEFDSIEELKAFDPDYIANNPIPVFENICQVLDCEISDITDIKMIPEGLNNQSFQFSCKGEKYIYRQPGANAENIIDRKKEARALRLVKKLGVDDSLVYIDEDEGWKISRFIETTEAFSFDNMKHVQLLADVLKKLDDADEKIGYTFDFYEESVKLLEEERHLDPSTYSELMKTEDKFQPIYQYLDEHPWQVSLCHNDIYEPNLLVDGDHLYLIDWEFAGDNDIGFDLCELFGVRSEITTYEEADQYLYTYFHREATDEEKLHLFACAAVVYHYYYIWALHSSRNNSSVLDYIEGWYNKMIAFSDEVLKRLS